MRRPCPALLAALFLASGCGHSAASEVSLRAMTYNIHWAQSINGTIGRPTGGVVLRRVIRDIRRSRAEVVSLQEAQSYRLPGGAVLSEPREIARALGWVGGGVGRHYYFRGGVPSAIWCRRQGDSRPVVRRIRGRRAHCLRHGNALLSKWPLSRERRFSLWRSDGDDSDGDAIGTFEGRVLIRARINFDGTPLWLWGTHLDPAPNIASCQLASALKRIETGPRTVLLADLNTGVGTHTNPNCPEAPERPFELLRDAGFRERLPAPLTYPSYTPLRAADHILVREGLSISRASVPQNCGQARPGAVRICSSDHRPVLVRIMIQP